MSQDSLVASPTQWCSSVPSTHYYYLPILLISLATTNPAQQPTTAYQLVVKDCSYGGHCTALPCTILLSSDVIESCNHHKHIDKHPLLSHHIPISLYKVEQKAETFDHHNDQFYIIYFALVRRISE